MNSIDLIHWDPEREQKRQQPSAVAPPMRDGILAWTAPSSCNSNKENKR